MLLGETPQFILEDVPAGNKSISKLGQTESVYSMLRQIITQYNWYALTVVLLLKNQYDSIKEYLPRHVIISQDRFVVFGMPGRSRKPET